jgi:hypothetical protein
MFYRKFNDIGYDLSKGENNEIIIRYANAILARDGIIQRNQQVSEVGHFRNFSTSFPYQLFFSRKITLETSNAGRQTLLQTKKTGELPA